MQYVNSLGLCIAAKIVSRNVLRYAFNIAIRIAIFCYLLFWMYHICCHTNSAYSLPIRNAHRFFFLRSKSNINNLKNTKFKHIHN